MLHLLPGSGPEGRPFAWSQDEARSPDVPHSGCYLRLAVNSTLYSRQIAGNIPINPFRRAIAGLPRAACANPLAAVRSRWAEMGGGLVTIRRARERLRPGRRGDIPCRMPLLAAPNLPSPATRSTPD